MRITSNFFTQFRLLFLRLLTLLYSCIAFSQPSDLSFENYTIENGLSNNMVNFSFQDKKGWMWFGTYQGLNRFDGYNFKVFESNPNDSASIGFPTIRCMFEDLNGKILIGTDRTGIFIFNREKENFKSFKGKLENFDLTQQSVNVIKQDNNGNFWIGTNNGLCYVSPSGKILQLFQHSNNSPNSIINSSIKALQIDRSGTLWVGTLSGLDFINPSTYKITHLNNQIPDVNDEIGTFFCDNDFKIWVGTYKNGIVIIDPLTLKSEHLIIDQTSDRSNTIRAIVKDNNTYWIGTRGGLYIYSKDSKRSSKFIQDERQNNSLVHNSVLNIIKDAKGDFWVATRGGISYVVREKQIFHSYRAFPNDNRYLNNSEVYAFWLDPQNRVWIGTETGGVNIFDRSTGTYTYLQPNSGVNSLSSNCIKAFTCDSKGNIWVGTFLGGIDVVNLQGRKIINYRNDPNNPSSLSGNKVWALYNDSKGNIWVGTNTGLDRFISSSKSFVHYPDIVDGSSVIWIKEDSNHDLWLSTNDNLFIYNSTTQTSKSYEIRTRMMHEDNQGHFWLTSLDKGLILFDKKKGIIKYFDHSNGLASNQAFCILEDNNGFFWISTINGLSRFDPRKEIFKNYDRRDGLLNNLFRYGACLKTPKGELIFGGITGFNILNPEEIKDNDYLAPIVLTNLKIFNKEVPIGDSNHDVLQQCITETQKIKLAYNQNSITIDFALLNYAKSSKNKYAYKLENFDKDWSELEYQHSATYMNLDPGKYRFIVKAQNSDGISAAENCELIIIVNPPLWKTWWFKLLAITVLLFLAYKLFVFSITRQHLKNELLHEKERAQKLHELDMLKVQFFTNVSHELRTPLTLIASPLDKMLKTQMTASEMRKYLELMSRNTRQLLQMVNQLLDFRKIETGNQKLELSQGDVVLFLKNIVANFTPLAQERKIRFEFNTSEKELYMLFDAEKLEIIINNLLSNAFKFTSAGGAVNLEFTLVTNNTQEHEDDRFVVILVKDTGIGISESNLNKIFNRFYRAENAKDQSGSGIGLTLTRELIRLHNGKIFVESNINKGSIFRINLPYLISLDEQSMQMSDLILPEIKAVDASPNISNGISDNNKILLVIDDNTDVRSFIRLHFEPEYTVLEAPNGSDGLSLAFKYIPDIIISDILMPVINGTEFCKRIKKDERTSHIPVLLLTALSSQTNKLEGVLAGADDYITKPFDIIFLKTKVDNLLMIRNMLREKYSEEFVLGPKKVILENPDERFLQKVIDTIEKNITDGDFNIDDLALEVGVSRTQIYRKMTVLTNMTVLEFIRTFRLKRAAQLLTQNKMNVSDVAYAVGYKDLSHFRKSFRQEFGMSASDYAEKYAE